MSKKSYHFEFKVTGIKSAFVYLVTTIIYTLLVMNVDKAAIGPNGTEVGFSKLNGFFAGKFGYNALCDKITDVALLIAILTAAGFAFHGLLQLIKGKSLLKVDKKIYGLALVYVVVVVLYVFFDKVPLNYRPVIVPGEVIELAGFRGVEVEGGRSGAPPRQQERRGEKGGGQCAGGAGEDGGG